MKESINLRQIKHLRYYRRRAAAALRRFDPRRKREEAMAASPPLSPPRVIARHVSFFFLLLLLLLLPLLALSKSSPRPITDDEIREKKNACYADIESGLWGWKCRASVIAKENCALLCLSPRCYELIYEDDPLEEGEKDFVRGQEYKYCMHKLSMGDSLDGVKGAFNF
ncbi:uncharacterized protein LOC109706656 [Ananas comosus]|uniref:Uncharacterized protein LOC109706656 n=1 Tax=Ananas comosus TaxID=4615 RepID=A0A6P5EIG8_ANACO|nr:uncharacterized protein LOC109706656 [Ananas comosus]